MILILSNTQCLKQFNRVELYTELMKCSSIIFVLPITQGFQQFGCVEINKSFSFILVPLITQ